MKYHVYRYILKSIQFPTCWYIMSWPNGPKSLIRDSGKITKLTKVLKWVLIAHHQFWLRCWLILQITAMPIKRITGQYSLLRTSALTWVLDRSLSHCILRVASACFVPWCSVYEFPVNPLILESCRLQGVCSISTWIKPRKLKQST